MKTSSNPLRKLVHRYRSRPSTTQEAQHQVEHPPDTGDLSSHLESISSSSLDFNQEELEAHRQEVLAFHDPLLPHLLSAVQDYQLTHGSLIKLVLHPQTHSLPVQHTVLARPIGVSLVPTLWPRERFDEAWELQEVLQELYCRVVGDEEWLWEVLKDCIGSEKGEGWSDGIVSGLWKVHEAVRDDTDGLGSVQDVELGLCRGDWMLGIDDLGVEGGHCEAEEQEVGGGKRLKMKPTLKQVELNTIATAGVSHSNIVSDMHQHLLRTGIYDSLICSASKEPVARDLPADAQSESTTLPSLPLNPTLAPHNNGVAGFARAVAQAHNLYGPPKSKQASKTTVLMVVQHDNVNIADERPIEYALWDLGVPCFRCEYREVLQRMWFGLTSEDLTDQPAAVKLDGGQGERGRVREATGRELLFSPFTPSPSHPSFCPPNSPETASGHDVYEISVIYLRSSLDSSELSPGRSLDTRLHLERSRAIKCPSVLGQLAACKRVQQHLSSASGAMERFIGEEGARRVRKRCMRMEGLDDEDGPLRKVLDKSVQDALSAKGRKAGVNARERDLSSEEFATAEAALSKYVLKPIGAEGGGHCIFGSVIPRFYAEHIAPEGRQAGYVLMERIHPPVVRGALLSQRGYYVGNVVSELGILGSVLWRRNRRKSTNDDDEGEGISRGKDDTSIEIISNEAVGWTLKSKSEDVPEMSVIKGYGCFDTPCLVGWDTYLQQANEGVRPGGLDDIA